MPALQVAFLPVQLPLPLPLRLLLVVLPLPGNSVTESDRHHCTVTASASTEPQSIVGVRRGGCRAGTQRDSQCFSAKRSAGSLPMLLSADVWGPGTASGSGNGSGSGSCSTRAGLDSSAACQQNIWQLVGALRLSRWHAQAVRLLADQTRPPAFNMENTQQECQVTRMLHNSIQPFCASEPENLSVRNDDHHDDAAKATGNGNQGPEVIPGWHIQSGSELPVPVSMTVRGESTPTGGIWSSEKARDRTDMLNRVGQSGFDLPGWTGSGVEDALDGWTNNGAGPSCTASAGLLNLNCMPNEEQWEVEAGMLMDAGEMHRGREAGNEQMLLEQQQSRHAADEDEVFDGCAASGAVPGEALGAFAAVKMHEYVDAFTGTKQCVTTAEIRPESGGVRGGGGGGARSRENKGAKNGMDRLTPKTGFCARSCSVTASQSAHEQNVTLGHEAVNYDDQLNSARRGREKGEWSTGLGGRYNGDENDSIFDGQEGGLRVKDIRVTEEGGGVSASGTSVDSDTGKLFRGRKKPGPSRKRGPVSKGCRDSRVSKHGA